MRVRGTFGSGEIWLAVAEPRANKGRHTRPWDSVRPATAHTRSGSCVSRQRALEVPITPRASGTSLSGAAIGPGVVLDTTRFHRILEFDPERRLVRVEPGILLAELNAYLADRGMRFAPDPGSQDLCRIGGMIGHNASGYRSVKYGQTRDHVAALKILLADGTAVHAHDVPVDGAEWRAGGGRARGVGGVCRERPGGG